MRRGFTLIEIVLALVIFEFGVLALCASTAVAARDFAIARRRMRAVEIAEARVESVRATACANPSSGSASTAGFTENWHVEVRGQTRALVDSVDYAGSGVSRRHLLVRRWAVCAG